MLDAKLVMHAVLHVDTGSCTALQYGGFHSDLTQLFGLAYCHVLCHGSCCNVKVANATAESLVELQKCGDIRTLYSACKHQGFVLITYFDGRAGNYAKAALDGALLNGRAVQIEPSAPGQKVHDKDTQSGETGGFVIC